MILTLANPRILGYRVSATQSFRVWLSMALRAFEKRLRAVWEEPSFVSSRKLQMDWTPFRSPGRCRILCRLQVTPLLPWLARLE